MIKTEGVGSTPSVASCFFVRKRPKKAPECYFFRCGLSFVRHIGFDASDDECVSDESGQGLAEYIIIVILVALLVIFGIRYYGGSIFGQFQNATEEINVASKSGAGEGSVSREGGGSVTRTTAGTSMGGSSTGDSSGGGGESEPDISDSASSRTSGTATSGEDELSEKVSSLRTGVGDTDDAVVVKSIQLDWSTLATIAGAILGLGVFVVFRGYQKQKKRSEGGKSKKKGLFGRLGGGPKGEGGQAIAEFTIIAITLLFVILGVIQLALVLNAYSMVRYAAYNAARAAIVHSGNEDKMLEAARLSLLATFPSHGRADTPRGLAQNYVASVATDSLPFLTDTFEPITRVELVPQPGLSGGTVVTFDDPKNAKNAVITVKVVHLYELVIPLVNRILYRVYRMNSGGGGYGGQTMDELSASTDRERRGGSLDDIEYRLPLVGFYTMRMQSDLEVP